MSTLRRFKPYPAYKDSGVEWLGEIPAGWQALKLKRVCSFAYGDSLASDARLDGEIEVYGSNGPVGSHDRVNTLAPCLVIGRKGSFGKVNYSARPVFAIDTTFFVDRRFTDSDLRWLYYALTDARLDSATKDSAIPGLDREDAYTRDLCLPPEPEQRAIAAFLDRETARIDALVAKKERLIELLQEKRTALITRAVTKGLDPTVPMKDSGVEWLGEIPAHWEVKRLKCIAAARIDKLEAKPEEAIYVGLEHVESWTGRLLLDNQPETVDSVVASFQSGDVLFGKLRPYLAKAARPDFDGVCTSEILALRPAAGCSQSFVMYCLLNAPYIRWLDSLTYGTKMPRVSPEQVAGSYMPLPPEPEQRAIAAFLDRETARIDAVIAKVRDAIERLKELRTALISAAVTGKIDVRLPAEAWAQAGEETVA